ncbi:hypothetical protein HOD75_04245 [archaeon]|mgnify:CR=1 FL=1|jgi:hypothetical protein|nr:hypothetical protein [archaeon]MBT4242074.1 hypothetical protein [archaeon]MBT4417762.1 hypothetical protein [archaeon]
MLPKKHIILGLVFTIIFYYIFDTTILQTTLIFLSTFLIDFDHYLWFIINKKDPNLKNAITWFKQKREKWIHLSHKEKQNYKIPLIVFHGLEFWIVLYIISLKYPLLAFSLIGISFHMVLDWIELIILKEPIIYKFSQTHLYLRNKGKKDFDLI